MATKTHIKGFSRLLAGWADKRGRMVCGCMGYHFPHRKGGGACDHSPRVDYYRALRADVPEDEALQLLWADKLERLP